jgi:S1-C subfamily serine protease
VITAVDGAKVASAAELQRTIDSKKPGDTVAVTYFRGGETHTAQVKLASRPS